MSNGEDKSNESKKLINWPIILISGGIVLLLVLFAVISPATAGEAFSAANAFITDKLGWTYLLATTFFLVVCIALALSRFGKIRLGKDTDRPEFSTRTWFFMLFICGMGIGLVFWSVAEPISHYMSPINAEPQTPAAALDAIRISFMHWGLHPWAVYGCVAMTLAYFVYRKNKPMLISSCLEPLFGKKLIEGWLGKLIDILAILATVLGVATSLGLAAMQINSGLDYSLGIPTGVMVQISIIAVMTVVFILSAVSGVYRGIKWLSNVNMVLVFILLIFVLVAGPTLFIINTFFNGVGAYIAGIVTQSLWTDPFNESAGWLSGWTIFYWAWWISWGPFVGVFLARISKGRTIREFVVGTLIAPTILGFLFMSILGGTALYFDQNGITSIAEATSENSAFALFALLRELPLTEIFTYLSVILIAIFFITSADSATLVTSILTARGNQQPPRFLRVFWGVAMSLVAIILLLVGGLSSLQTASIVGALPFMIVIVLMCFSIFKALRSEKKPELVESTESGGELEPALAENALLEE